MNNYYILHASAICNIPVNQSKYAIGYPVENDLIQVIDQDQNGFSKVTWHGKTGYVLSDNIGNYIPVFEDTEEFLPQDEEINVASRTQNAFQYISLEKLGFGRTPKTNLCGEFCIAQLAKMNVIDFLALWMKNYPVRANQVLQNNLVTGVVDIQNMLEMVGYRGIKVQFDLSNHASIEKLHDILPAILGVGLSGGQVQSTEIIRNGKVQTCHVRHWIDAFETKAFGTGGYVKAYNPLFNFIDEIPYSEIPEMNGNLLAIKIEKN